MHDRTLEAWINRSDHRLLGSRLRPFSLAHLLILECIQSPLRPGCKSAIAWHDIRLAARVCSSIPARLFDPAFFRTNPWKELLDAWRYRITDLRGPRDPAQKLQHQLDAWHAYIADYHTAPLWWDALPDESAPPCKLAAALTLAGRIIRVTGWPEETVWAMPIGKLSWYSAAFALADGHGSDLVSAEEEDFLRQAGKI